jgi:poly(3-hydroxybutyrate) depolymerase
VVYPEGRVIDQNCSWNAGACCPPALKQNMDDVGFVDRLLDAPREQYTIDTTRVYATGSSNGGMLCYRLACELGHRFAAMAPNACSQTYASCAPTNKIPIISFHSKVDPIVPFSGGPGGAPPLTNIVFPSLESILQFWSLWNACQTIDTVINGNGTGYDLIRAQDHACEVEVHQIATTDGGHSWPGRDPNNNPVSTPRPHGPPRPGHSERTEHWPGRSFGAFEWAVLPADRQQIPEDHETVIGRAAHHDRRWRRALPDRCADMFKGFRDPRPGTLGRASPVPCHQRSNTKPAP